MSYTSDFLNNSTVIQAKASPIAIAVNDLLLSCYNGQVYPAQTVSYAAGQATATGSGNAGAAIIPNTVITASQSATSEVRQSCFVNPPDGAMYFMGPHLGSNSGIKISKFSSLGNSLGSLVLETTATTTVTNLNLLQLSNGNLVAIWGLVNANIYYAIFDLNLNLIVAKTLIGASNGLTNPGHACVLSGGGFAYVYQAPANGLNLAIINNAGGVVLAPTLLPGTSLANPYPKVAQLSNGNLAIVLTSTAAANAIGHLIYTAAGAAILPYTVIDNGTKTAIGFPDITVLPGFYSMGATINATAKAYVLANTGAVQGAAFSDVAANVGLPVKMLNDGAAFWFIYPNSGGTMSVAYMPTNGAGYVASVTQTSLSGNSIDAFLERGHIVITCASIIASYSIRANNTMALVNSFSATTGNTDPCLRPVGDFSALIYNTQGGQSFALFRYCDASIIGVSKAAVGAGNAGTLVQISIGPGAFITNAMTGLASRTFDHLAGNLIGNKGTVMQNAVTLKGF